MSLTKGTEGPLHRRTAAIKLTRTWGIPEEISLQIVDLALDGFREKLDLARGYRVESYFPAPAAAVAKPGAYRADHTKEEAGA